MLLPGLLGRGREQGLQAFAEGGPIGGLGVRALTGGDGGERVADGALGERSRAAGGLGTGLLAALGAEGRQPREIGGGEFGRGGEFLD